MKPIELLEQCILALAPKHHACNNAPNDYDSLMSWALAHTKADSLPVYNGSSDKTIFSSDKVNFAFRAWHDAIHINEALTFSYADEMEVAEHHVAELLAWSRKQGYNKGLALQAASLIYADVAGQVEYYYHHKKYVDNQAAFDYDYINNGFELPSGVY